MVQESQTEGQDALSTATWGQRVRDNFGTGCSQRVVCHFFSENGEHKKCGDFYSKGFKVTDWGALFGDSREFIEMNSYTRLSPKSCPVVCHFF